MSRLRGCSENQRGDNGGMRWWEGAGGEGVGVEGGRKRRRIQGD